MAYLSTNQSNIGCKWIFKTKKNTMSVMVRHKKRLVAKKYSQVSIDSNETYTLLAKFTTIKTIVAIKTIIDL